MGVLLELVNVCVRPWFTSSSEPERWTGRGSGWLSAGRCGAVGKEGSAVAEEEEEGGGVVDEEGGGGGGGSG